MAARGKKAKSLAALARSLDTTKRPLPPPGAGGLPRSATAKGAITRQLGAKPASAAPTRVEKVTAALAPSPRVELTRPRAPSAAAPTATRAAPPAPRPPPAASTRPVAAPAVRSPPGPSGTARTAALASLQRTPSPAPSRAPAATRPTPPEADPRRRYPRAPIAVHTRLSLVDDPSRVFEASLPTVNLSVGGLFLHSTYFLKVGTRLLVTLSLPPDGREVRVKAEVVRVESSAEGQSGFALRFTEYLDGSQVALATHFLSPVLREFLVGWARAHRFEPTPEYLAHTIDVLAAWELEKAELGGDVWRLAER